MTSGAKKQPSRKNQKQNARASDTKKQSYGKIRKQSKKASGTRREPSSKAPKPNTIASGTKEKTYVTIQRQESKVTSTRNKQPSGKIQKKKIWGSKQVLSSPFALTFPLATAGTKMAILNLFAQQFPEPFGKRNTRPSLTALADEGTRIVDKERRKGERSERKKPLRLLLGINEVTRALERNSAELVVVSRDVTPAFLITHIPILCFVKSANLVVLSGNGTELGHILGIRRCMALCVLKNTSVNSDTEQSVDRLVEKLRPCYSKLDYKWLAAIRGKTTPCLPDPSMVPHKKKEDILAPLDK